MKGERVSHVISDEASQRADGQVICEDQDAVLKRVGQSRRSEEQHAPVRKKADCSLILENVPGCVTQGLKNSLGLSVLLGDLRIGDVSKPELFSQEAGGRQELGQTRRIGTRENT